MYNGVWVGDMANKGFRLLILGESHYGENVYDTKGVVSKYLRGNETGEYASWYPFFDKIAQSFGYLKDPNDFYDKVYFANYIEEPCGIGDDTARTLLSKHRWDYFEHFVDFVNENEIDCVVCFSKLVYWHLGPLLGDEMEDYKGDIILGEIGGRRNLANFTRYKPIFTDSQTRKVPFKKELKVYGFRHPSCQGGYDCNQVYSFIKDREELKNFCI